MIVVYILRVFDNLVLFSYSSKSRRGFIRKEPICELYHKLSNNSALFWTEVPGKSRNCSEDTREHRPTPKMTVFSSTANLKIGR